MLELTSHLDAANREESETRISGNILGSGVSVLVPDNLGASNNIRLIFKSGNLDLLFKLKNELLREKCSHLVDSGKAHVPVSCDLVRKVEDLRSFLSSIDDQATEENFATLEVCYNFLRQEISSELP